ncbi:MAG: hypothetical protein KBF73_12135 [Flavobacteriales bacterium]|nr:hypothetical protein [Flavobacteriales bacterium]
MEKVIYQWLKRNYLAFHYLENQHLLMELHAQLAEFETQRFTEAEELGLWVLSLTKQPP